MYVPRFPSLVAIHVDYFNSQGNAKLDPLVVAPVANRHAGIQIQRPTRHRSQAVDPPTYPSGASLDCQIHRHNSTKAVNDGNILKEGQKPGQVKSIR
jgi:hypothetical protein